MKIKYFDENKTKFLNGITMINMQNMYGNIFHVDSSIYHKSSLLNL